MPQFPSRWPPRHPERLQLYSMETPNGQKIRIALEELELPYDYHRLDILAGDQHDPEYLTINPNGKIPSLVDPDGDVRIMESGAILHYLARKTGRLMPRDAKGENEVLQWLFFQVGSVGPMFGQFGHFFKYAKGKTDRYGEERYGKEVTRLLGVLDRRLEGRDWLVGEYTVADIATAPWVKGLAYYGGEAFVGYERFTNVHAWQARFLARPAVVRGLA
jgi:GST-like protein